jgi:KDO2-lipid IV(A) lauroyltransferase
MSVPFFGRPARTPVAPVLLALRRRLPLHPIFIRRLADGGHEISIEPALDLQRSGDELADVRAGLARISRRFEEEVRRHPDQWMWWHRRWRRQPVPELDLDGEFQYTRRESTSPPHEPGAAANRE